MTKLISGRIAKVDSANVSADRYQFIELSETEPDLGLPSELGQIFTSDLSGNRYWVRLDTANVTELNNLYFTNTRVISALVGANVSLNNLIVSGDLEVQGNLVTLNVVSVSIEDKNLLLANGATNSAAADGAGITIAGANAEITYQNTGDRINFNKPVNVQGNLTIDGSFVGNGLIIRNIAVTDEILTGNILGQGFTSNTIVVSETLTGNIITANVVTSKEWYGIYTANVLETSGNLYYTNDRVFSFVTGMSIGDLVDVANIYTHNGGAYVGIQEGQALVWDGNVFIPVFVNSEVANVADLAVKVLNLENQTTANVREAASNLYFTNTRVLDAISLATINPNNINANNIVVDSITANIWNRIYTANVIETAGNLYFTTQRARSSVSNSTGVYYSSDNGVFSIGQDVAITSDVQFRDLTLSGNLFILGNVAIIAANTLEINDPIIHLGLGNPGDQWDIGFVGHYVDAGDRHTGLFRDATDKKFKFFSNTTVDPSNVNYIDTTEDSFRLASVVAETFEGNVIGTVSSIANHNTDALAEGVNNLYYTNARTVQTVTPLFTTANVVELTNQYFTNVRVLQAVEPRLTTANVTELDNLYFTNARVLANVEQMSVNVFADVDISGVAVNATLVWDGTKFVPGSTDTSLRSNFANAATFANIAGSSNVALLADLANLVSSLSNHNTSNLAEGTNLYYTNSRVLSALVFANVLVADLTAAGNLVANGLIIRGINVNDNFLTGNINITNIAAANVINANIISAQQWQGIYTANVIESPTNLYFTNTRAISVVTPLLTTANVNEFGSNLYFTPERVVQTVTPLLTTANVNETGANLYFTPTRVVQTVTPLLTTANVNETGANLYFTNARVLASLVNANVLVADLTAAGNLVANGLIIRGINVTDAVLTGNLTVTNITNGNVIIANVISSQVWQNLYSGNIIESTNLFFSNARVNVAVRPMMTTANVVEKDNLYFTIQRVFDTLSYANLGLNNLTVIGDLEVLGNTVTLNTGILTVEDKNITLANGSTSAAVADGAGIHVAGAGANIIYEVAGDVWGFNKDIRVTGNIIATANLIANGLIIRNINVSDTVLAGNVTGTAVTGANLLADSVTANIWNRLYTANVIETAGNLYFTTARARASFTAGENVTITDGEISAQLGSTVVVNDSTTVVAAANTLTYSMGRNITDPRNVLVIIEGLLQIPTTDYTVSGSSLTLTSQPPVGTSIEIRFFGTEAFRSTTPSTLATVNTFVGNGANSSFNLTVSPPSKSYVTVVIDGVTQLAEAYEIVGTTLILDEAPDNSANIDVRIITGVGTGAFNTRTFNGDGANTNFTITSGFSNDTILVFENGVAQVPVTDYNVSGTTLQFTTAPAPNVIVQIRELGVVPNVSQQSNNLVFVMANSLHWQGETITTVSAALNQLAARLYTAGY